MNTIDAWPKIGRMRVARAPRKLSDNPYLLGYMMLLSEVVCRAITDIENDPTDAQMTDARDVIAGTTPTRKGMRINNAYLIMAHREYADDARAWFAANDGGVPWSFQWICDVFEMDRDKAMSMALAKKE